MIILVRAQFIGELLGVQRPSFRIRVERKQLSDERHLVRVFPLPDVSRNRFVESEIGQTVLAVQLCRSEVDPETPGNFSVDRSRSTVGAGRTGFFLRRKTL